eukprot:992596_1
MATEPQQNGPPPPVPSDAIIDSKESNINPEDDIIDTIDNNSNDNDNDDIEMNYTNIEIPAAIPTESIRDLMYENNENENESDNNNDNVSTPLLEDEQLPHNATTHNAILHLNFD